MSSYEQRVGLTDMIARNFDALFPKDTCAVREFGCDRIIGDNADLWDFVKEPAVNQQASAMIVKFAPDFILLRKTEPKELFFVDVKHSTAPTWAPSRLSMLQKKNADYSLSTDRIGVVAREALLSYRRYFPNTIVLMASPYNKKLLMAQFAKDIRCLYCYRTPDKDDYDCKECPEKKGEFFDIERAVNAAGSQTPMTNVDLDSFLPAAEFFNKLGIRLNEQKLNALLEEIKKEPLEIEDTVYPNLKNRVFWNVNQACCTWVDYELYSCPGNDFYHLDKNCTRMQGNENRIETYHSLEQANAAGKRINCRSCCPRP